MVTKVEKVIYKAHATATGGRDGTVKSSASTLSSFLPPVTAPALSVP